MCICMACLNKSFAFIIGFVLLEFNLQDLELHDTKYKHSQHCSFQQEILVTLSADLMKICRFLHVNNRIWFLFLVKKNMTGGYTPSPFQRLNGRSLRSAIICILIQCYKGYEFLVFITTFSNILVIVFE